MTIAAAHTSEYTAPAGWVRVCALADLEVERGRAALLSMTRSRPRAESFEGRISSGTDVRDDENFWKKLLRATYQSY